MKSFSQNEMAAQINSWRARCRMSPAHIFDDLESHLTYHALALLLLALIRNKQGRIHGHKSLLEGRKARTSPTDGRTDRRTDGPTDGRTDPLIELLRRD